MSYLEIKNVNKYYSKFHVLKNISLSIEKGEFISFLGPSGCGKTTLLRVISGLEELNSGNIFLKGKDISILHPSKRNFSIVFQSYALFPNMTTWENIAYGLKNKKMPKDLIEKKVKSVLEMVGLFSISNKYPNEMSGGQQQRVALARAVALEPDILLLDEPLSALDAKVRESLRVEIKRIQKALNITTIMVTHDQEEALTMGDKIVIFNNGEVMQEGTPEEIYYEPINDFTADFIGKINFIDQKDGKTLYIRPECIEFGNILTFGYKEGIVKGIEFRGNIYRVLVYLENMNIDIYIDMSWKEKNSLDIEVGTPIYVKLNSAIGVYKYA